MHAFPTERGLTIFVQHTHWIRHAAAALLGVAIASVPMKAPASPAAEPSVATAESKPLSRAEVIADLRLWRRARVDVYADLALSYQVHVAEYEKALAEYRKLRAGPAYQAEVEAVRREMDQASQ
ncbi:MAG: hypothetical protein JNL93_04950 [Pelomonas sp.]|nr:hypothetical protein [Roseateles sp.]